MNPGTIFPADSSRNLLPSRESLRAYQLQRLNVLLAEVLSNNKFYRDRYRTDSLQLDSLDALSDLPLMQKSDWINDDPTGIANHHSFAADQYRRYHRTSGTRGRPMVILDSQRDWEWWIRNLAVCSRCLSDHSARSGTDGFFLWAFYWFLECSRCLFAPRVHGHSVRWYVDRS